MWRPTTHRCKAALTINWCDLNAGEHDASGADYRVSQSRNRPRLGTLFELLLFHLVCVNFPGFRLFLVFPRLPIVSMLQGVRICFFVFPIADLLKQLAPM